MSTDPSRTPTDLPVVELRQYTLRPGRRDDLIALFDREFVETQEAAGIRVLGQFRDLDDPDRFVWLRGFSSLASRAAALGEFYGGPTWAAHRDAANATMVDSDDVLLLRPARPGSGLRVEAGARAARDATRPADGVVEMVVLSLAAPADAAVVDKAVGPLSHAWRDAGAKPLASYVTEPAPNDFPRLPVREGGHVVVALALFDDAAAQALHTARRAPHPVLAPALVASLAAPPRVLRLAPTARSALHARSVDAARAAT